MSGQAVCAMYKHAGELYHSDAILAQAGTSLRTGKACGTKSNKFYPTLPNPGHQRVERECQKEGDCRAVVSLLGQQGPLG